MMSEEEEELQEEATVKLMLIVLSQEAIEGFHQQVLSSAPSLAFLHCNMSFYKLGAVQALIMKASAMWGSLLACYF